MTLKLDLLSRRGAATAASSAVDAAIGSGKNPSGKTVACVGGQVS